MRPIFTSLILVLSVPCIGQVFLPDTVLRNALNAQVPGIVDGAGILDTAHPDIGSITALSLTYFWDTSIDLAGLEALPSLDRLGVFSEVDEPSAVSIMAFPPLISRIGVHVNGGGSVALGDVPSTLEFLQFISWEDFTDFNVNSFADTLDQLHLEYQARFSLNQPGYIRSVLVHGYGNILPSPPIQWWTDVMCKELTLSSFSLGENDLQGISCKHLRFSECTFETVSLPGDLTSLIIDNLGLGEIVSFPPTLDSLEVRLWNGSFCLPPLPDALAYLRLDSSATCLPNWPASLATATIDGIQYDQGTMEYCSIANSECPGTNPVIMGSFFVDGNGNGTLDGGESGWGYGTVVSSPGGSVAGCDVAGDWTKGVLPGIYDIQPASSNPYVIAYAPVTHNGMVPNMGDMDADNHFAVTLMPNMNDLQVSIDITPTRPGFENRLFLNYRNYGSVPIDAILTLNWDTDQQWVGSSINPTNLTGNTVTWDLGTLQVAAQEQVTVDLYTSPDVPIGTAIDHTLTINPLVSDETPADNIADLVTEVVGSYDPNDKLLTPAALTPDEVALGETPIEYTIRFQNTGTYHAERVVILDTLSEDLQWESMRSIASSHDQHWYIVDGVLHVVYDNIMLPDSNANEPESHGFFQFSMLPKSDLVNGSVIENIAHIIFDFNEPIITAPAVFLVDITSGVEPTERGAELSILPNPAHDRIQIRTEGTTAMPYRIMDMLGQEVLQGSVLPNVWIDVQPLANGPYVFEVTEAGARKCVRFMKQ